jgi:hypothetical protein
VFAGFSVQTQGDYGDIDSSPTESDPL